jgi:Ino eighty subunit 1
MNSDLEPVFPEMKTVIRTYHPVPSLQRTDGNLQDAPRIKSILKACLLDSEGKSNGAPSTPLDILARSVGH